ncbi:MFS transporter [Vibrio coralliilyticus OCN008]|uniref:MFS transporter n=1 Tax=Vibrio coralliilyticus TaxID=190893 RepID=UPI000390E8D6|nr:MFS transporter [Vibrio coralliilyticus]ERB66477.1 MFS transporter [Vibrio coralliilyticus OCN008]QIJ86897.1 MFS transporter [Vibrio coralliilyticus OCN008]
METLSHPQNSVWKNRSFVVLFSSALFVAFSAQIYNLALPLLVYELTQSSQMMGWMRAVEFLPNLLLALFIGVWVDRVDKKRWSQMMLLGQLLMVLSCYFAVEWLDNPLWVLFPSAFFMMACNYGYHNARMAMMKNGIPHELQNTAIARMSSLSSFMETVGPVLSGALMLLSAIHNVFLGVAAMLVLAYWQLEKLALVKPEPKSHPPVLQALAEGWAILRAETNMWYITLAVMVINTTGAIFWIQSIFYAKSTLSLNSVEVSYLIAASGVGGLLGSFTADKIRTKFGLGQLLIASIALEAFGFLIPLALPGVWSLVFAFLWISAIGLYSSICIWSYRQEAFDEQCLGRLTGITGSLFKLLMPFGLAASGYMVASFGEQAVFVSCFILQLLVALILLFSRVRFIQ